MNSGRFWLLAVSLVGVAFLVAPGCGGGGGSPCTNCPPIEGTYALEFAPGPVPQDCADLGVQLPSGPLEIERTGPQLNVSLNGVELTGTLYASYDFNLLSNPTQRDGGTDTLTLSGRYVPVLRDSGTAQINGTFLGNYTRTPPQGTRRCTLSRSYTATPE